MTDNDHEHHWNCWETPAGAGYRIRAEVNEIKINTPTRADLKSIVDKLNAELRSLQNSRSELSGKASEKSVQKANAIAMLGLVAGAGSIIIRLLLGH